MNGLEDIVIRRLGEGEEYPLELLLTADPSRKLVEEYMARGQCFIALHENRVIGEYVLLNTRPGRIEIMNIAVVPEKQGRGAGKFLIMDAVQRVREYGAKYLEIGTGNSSLMQLGLYQRCGFRIVGIEKDYFLMNYDFKIEEKGITCRDMVRLSLEL